MTDKQNYFTYIDNTSDNNSKIMEYLHKQIIIDGCDVSGCEWIREVGLDSEYICTCNSPNKTSGYCKYNPNCHHKLYKRKEQECEELKVCLFQVQNASISLTKQLDLLEAEVKSKTEYIQEQRDIINQYSKEIEMYKKCQGKRASKREEELKADNKHLDNLLNQALKELEQSREAVEKIKAIAEKNLNIHTCAFKGCGYDLITKQILQICDEVN